MRRLSLVGILLLLSVLLAVMQSHAQTQDRPLVVFIVGRPLESLNYSDVSATGLSNLAVVFNNLGARVQFLETERPIPSEARLVVIARPLRQLTFIQVARLWVHLRRGNNLLVAVDPDNHYIGFTNVNTNITRSALQPLLTSDYGIIMENSFLAEPWFTSNSIADLNTTYTRTYADVVSNPITQPLADYELPVWVWGARHMRVEPLGINSYAVPLLYNETGYAETNTAVFRRASGRSIEPAGAPLELNLGEDVVGRRQYAAMAENTETGSRVVILGDSEILQNGFGLSMRGSFPRHPGNRIFVERMAGWLLEVPVDTWPALPIGFTWLSINGDSSDWDNILNETTVSGETLEAASENIREIRAFSDNLYVYLLIDTETSLDEDTGVRVRTGAGQTVIGREGTVTLQQNGGEGTVIDEANIAVGDVIEMRLPRRIFASPPRLSEICVAESFNDDDSPLFDCYSQPITASQLNLSAPFDFSLSSGMVATVSSTSDIVNMRSAPNLSGDIVVVLDRGTVLSAIGRNSSNTWVQVRNSLFTGWISAPLLNANGDLSYLPVVDES